MLGIDKEIILNAISLEMNDFEDAVQTSSAIFNDIEIIITRNKSDFKNTSLKIVTPEEFLASSISRLLTT